MAIRRPFLMPLARSFLRHSLTGFGASAESPLCRWLYKPLRVWVARMSRSETPALIVNLLPASTAQSLVAGPRVGEGLAQQRDADTLGFPDASVTLLNPLSSRRGRGMGQPSSPTYI